MKKQITPAEYDALDAEGKYGYHPIYASYKTKKVREYSTCDLGYDHFMGWVDRTTPVGEPIHYKYSQPFVPYSMLEYFDDRLLATSLTNTVYNNKPMNDGEAVTIKFTRHTPLEDHDAHA